MNQINLKHTIELNERNAWKFLDFVESIYRTTEFGFAFNDTRIYQNLRKAIGYTAGGKWRKHICTTPAENLQASAHNNTNMRRQLKELGWSQFELDHTSLCKIINNCQIKNDSTRISHIDPGSAFKFLKIIPTNIFTNIKAYLGTNKIWICSPTILHSKPFKHLPTQKELSDHAFMFHRDIDSTAAVKIFVNLTTTAGGNHEYFQKSLYTATREISPDFNPPLFHDEFFAKTEYETHVHTGRFSAQSLKDIYGHTNLIKMPTQKGFAWVEDTYGLHRGTPCTDGERQILSILVLKDPVRI